MTPTALQRIKEIDTTGVLKTGDAEFLLKAFNVMWEIALKQEKETGVFVGVVNADFEKEMSK